MARALYHQRRYAEALPLARAGVARNPTQVITRATVAASLGQTGPDAEARAAAAELQRLSPGYTIAEFKRAYSTSVPAAEVEHYADGLRKAGVPE